MTKNAHLTLEDRRQILRGLENGASRTAIGQTLGKNKSTISREIKNRRKILRPRSNQCRETGKMPVFDCIHMNQCGRKNVCKDPCKEYEMAPCVRRDKKVGVCNGCESLKRCKQMHYIYNPEEAQDAYKETLSDSRAGINMTTVQAAELGELIAPLIRQGHSPYAIVRNNRDTVKVSEKTLYNYITQGVFRSNGIIDLDLRLKTSRKPSKKKVVCRPREQRAYIKERTYHDFSNYMNAHPNALLVEMDTVYNDEENGPFIQTFIFVQASLLVAVLHEEKTAQAMYDGVCEVKRRLGEHFSKCVNVILTDRGSEFSKAKEIEALGVKIFYCDPQCSWQKGHVENVHTMVRWVLPNKKNLRELGLVSQEVLDLITSHVNSYPRENLRNKTAYEVMEFYYGKTVLDALLIEKIPPNDVDLTPKLIKVNK